MSVGTHTPREVPEELEPPDREAQELAHHPSIKQYVVVAIALAVATGFEVALYYLSLPRLLLILLLLFFAIIKFALVMLFFMHLRFDNPLFRRLFVTGLILALAVYTVVLVTFGIFSGGNQG
jgi:cytochrome c oxidase subunit IV